jgi:hypothetical protein
MHYASDALVQELAQTLNHIGNLGWSSDLIGEEAEGLAGGDRCQKALQKTTGYWSRRPVHQGQAANGGLGIDRQNMGFGCRFVLAIDIDGGGAIDFPVGGLGSVKNLVCRGKQEGNTLPGASLS